jgi:hypothetical protein
MRGIPDQLSVILASQEGLWSMELGSFIYIYIHTHTHKYMCVWHDGVAVILYTYGGGGEVSDSNLGRVTGYPKYSTLNR